MFIKWFETFSKARKFRESVNAIDYGIKFIDGVKMYYVKYEK